MTYNGLIIFLAEKIKEDLQKKKQKRDVITLGELARPKKGGIH